MSCDMNYGIYKMGIRGQKGESGEKGEQGERGFQGVRGLPGQPGEKGDPGQPGQPGEKGEQGERGEKGEKGEKGDKGDKGDKGEKGEPGTLEGHDVQLWKLTDENGKIVPSDCEDFNEVKTTGWFYCENKKNSPDKQYHYWILEVIAINNDSVYQRATVDENGINDKYERNFIGNEWSEWQEFSSGIVDANIPVESGVDFNNFDKNGAFYVSNIGTQNSPLPSKNISWLFENFYVNATTQAQKLSSIANINDNVIKYERHKFNSEWSEWYLTNEPKPSSNTITNIDFNNFDKDGNFYVPNTGTNNSPNPSTTYGWFFESRINSETNRFQRLIMNHRNSSEVEVYERSMLASQWNEWRLVSKGGVVRLGIDFNNFNENGKFYVYNNTTNSPLGNTNDSWFLENTFLSGTSVIYQRAVCNSGDTSKKKSYERFKSGGSWEPWREL